MVYVLSKTGQPLMPTENHAKVRVLLKQQKAKIVHRCPFTIQLLYDSTDYTQPVSLGIDAGSRHIGVSATTETKVLYEADVTLRNDIVDLLSTRRETRRARRNRKTRYRKPRFNNRTRKNGWLAPSVQQKVDTHLTVVRKVTEILPVSNITVETASFDIQKIKNPDISGTGYQQGEQLGVSNSISGTSGSMCFSAMAIRASAAKESQKIRCLTYIISKAARPGEMRQTT